MIRRLVCRLVGHRWDSHVPLWDWSWFRYYYPCICSRCGAIEKDSER